MSEDAGLWQMRVRKGLEAHFKQPDGPSRPGTDWSVQLKRGAEEYAATVRTYLADDLSPKLKKNGEYLAQTAMSYLNDLLNQGWHPSEPRDLAITVGNPPGMPPARKPFWKFW